MATIPTVSHGAYKNTPRRIYVAAKAFNNDFYTYTVTTDVNGLTTGALTVVISDAAQTPVGRTLRETGAKLYPGANPGITTYMVKVYDDQTGLSGFINPNSATFAIFNTDKPTYLTDGSEITSPAGSYSGQNEGNSLYTLGTVTAGAGVVATTGGVTATAGGVTATAGGLTATAGGLTVSAGRITLPVTSGAAAVGTVTASGTTAVTVNNSLVTANSFIFLSLAQAPSGVTSPTAYVFARTAGTSFQIKAAAGDTSVYNYLIVN